MGKAGKARKRRRFENQQTAGNSTDTASVNNINHDENKVLNRSSNAQVVSQEVAQRDEANKMMLSSGDLAITARTLNILGTNPNLLQSKEAKLVRMNIYATMQALQATTPLSTTCNTIAEESFVSTKKIGSKKQRHKPASFATLLKEESLKSEKVTSSEKRKIMEIEGQDDDSNRILHTKPTPSLEKNAFVTPQNSSIASLAAAHNTQYKKQILSSAPSFTIASSSLLSEQKTSIGIESLSCRVGNALHGEEWDKAIVLLEQMQVLKITPRLGSMQRWVRDIFCRSTSSEDEKQDNDDIKSTIDMGTNEYHVPCNTVYETYRTVTTGASDTMVTCTNSTVVHSTSSTIRLSSPSQAMLSPSQLAMYSTTTIKDISTSNVATSDKIKKNTDFFRDNLGVSNIGNGGPDLETAARVLDAVLRAAGQVPVKSYGKQTYSSAGFVLDDQKTGQPPPFERYPAWRPTANLKGQTGLLKEETSRPRVVEQTQSSSSTCNSSHTSSKQEHEVLRQSFEKAKYILCVEQSWKGGLTVWGCESSTRILEPGNSPVVHKHPIPFVQGSFLLTNVLTPIECQRVIQMAHLMGFNPEASYSFTGKGSPSAEGCVWVADPSTLNKTLFDRVKAFLPPFICEGALTGLNPRWRIYRYTEGSVYRPHADGSWPQSGFNEQGHYVTDVCKNSKEVPLRSRLTFLVYLNDNFQHGGTTFYSPSCHALGSIACHSIAPQCGAVLCFPHGEDVDTVALIHEGSAVTRGTKYVIRTDVMYEKQTTARVYPP